MKPDIESVEKLLMPDFDTGRIFWKTRVYSNGKIFSKQAGKEAGWFGDGRHYIRINGILIARAIVIWALHKGSWPIGNIDHKNGVTSDDRINNLRETTVSENLCNRPAGSNNTSGAKGVWFCRQTGKWGAEVMKGGRKIWLGRHDTFEKASAVRDLKARELHGEFYCPSHRNLPEASQQPPETPLSK